MTTAVPFSIGMERSATLIANTAAAIAATVPLTFEDAAPNPAYLYFGSILPCAAIRSSHISQISSVDNSAAVWGSINAAW